MTIYDAAMIGLVVAGMVWGAWRGIIWQVASISSLVLGYAAAHQLSPQLAPHLPGEPVVARGLAMLLIYAAASGGIFLVAWTVRSTLRQLRFEAFDRHLGMVRGGIEGALLGLVGTLFVVSLDQSTRAPIFSSPTGRIVSQVMNYVGPVLPGEAREALAPFWNAAGGPVAGRDADVPVTTTAAATPAAQPAAQDQAGSGTGGSDATATATAAKLENLIEEGESRLGRAIVETAEKGMQQSSGGNDRAPQRR
jgi:membrane protein required for colicin V production